MSFWEKCSDNGFNLSCIQGVSSFIISLSCFMFASISLIYFIIKNPRFKFEALPISLASVQVYRTKKI